MLTRILQDPACCRTVSIGNSPHFFLLCHALRCPPAGDAAVWQHRCTSTAQVEMLRFSSQAAALPALCQARGNLSPTSGTRALLCRFPGRGEEEKPPALSGALPPFLQAELQPLFCSAPRGILSPSTMKSVTFKLLYCNLGTFGLSAVTRRGAPATQCCIPPRAIANIYRSGSSLQPTVLTLGTTFVLVFSPGSDR